ncbi:hypothetical protein SAMN04489718_3986 [Actinopolyspora saharensis]|uniref:Uncharacterized protein n=1 Tax=Actinopolyspora saharensis TaxID=995062 RepID=A0A1H1GZP2_9ACTN|nr:hypothetical protein SAMN04489718_3986 [Actinopolyspora saharensis]
MNVLAVGLIVMAIYLALMLLWTRHDRRLDEKNTASAVGSERR